jgi:NAD(P)-dependent dehydrogenase (short-subunit alcohol dehydrogenase family)
MQHTTLITGAGKRIGATIARHLAAQGHALVLHYHQSKAEAEVLAAELKNAHATTVTLVQANLSQPDTLVSFWSGLPPVTHLVHNASRFTRDSITSMTPHDLRDHLAVNFESPLLLTQGFVKQLPARTEGTVTVLGDGTIGWSISPEFFSYAISKHAWASTIELLAAACAPHARVNMIALGPTLPGAQDDDSMFTRLAAHAPLKRHGTPAEVITALDYLLAAPGVTGQIISLANGFGLSGFRPPEAL